MNPNQVRIAFSGKNRAGKDSAVAALVARNPYGEREMSFRRFGFADTLKIQAARMIGKSDDFFFDEENKKEHRMFLIDLGTAGRSYHPLFWVKKTLEEISASTSTFHVPLVSDCRFKNEAIALRAAGFKLVRIECPDDVRIARGGSMDPKVTTSSSEVDLDDWTDWDLVCDSSKMTAGQIADTVIQHFLDTRQTVNLSSP